MSHKLPLIKSDDFSDVLGSRMFSLTRQNLTHALSMLLMRVPGSMIITSPPIWLPHSQPLGRGHRTCNIAMCFISRKTLSTNIMTQMHLRQNSGWPSPSTLDLPGRASVVSCSAGKALVEFLWQRKKELSRAVISHKKKTSSSITNPSNALSSIQSQEVTPAYNLYGTIVNTL